ncbi:hypothetical protein [Clostridium sp.]|uniref:hypothetical protein n=1 Tax=Clostridium sp. TaxID=1506 RepID=UPI001B53A2A2|nr:hypothetical protein [Clostridium sp.]MBP3916202.1 hypothetical protein [Clostridium sp.]
MKAIEILNSVVENDTKLYKHLWGAYTKAKNLLDGRHIDSDIKEKIINTVMLHDIGYSKKIAEVGDHNLDGYNFLLKKYPGVTFEKCVLLHGNYIGFLTEDDMHENNASKVLLADETNKSLTQLEEEVLNFLDYCDITTDGNGECTTVNGRLVDIIKRYGTSEVKVKNFENHIDAAYRVCERIHYTINKIENMYIKDKSLDI